MSRKTGDQLLVLIVFQTINTRFLKVMRKLLIIGSLSIIKRLKTVETLWENKWNKCLKAIWNFPSARVSTDRDSQKVAPKITGELSVWEQLVCGIHGKDLAQPLSAGAWQLSVLLGTEAGRNYFNCRVHEIKIVKYGTWMGALHRGGFWCFWTKTCLWREQMCTKSGPAANFQCLFLHKD